MSTFSQCQYRYDNMMPDDDIDNPDEVECPECGNDTEIDSDNSCVCKKCGNQFDFDFDEWIESQSEY